MIGCSSVVSSLMLIVGLRAMFMRERYILIPILVSGALVTSLCSCVCRPLDTLVAALITGIYLLGTFLFCQIEKFIRVKFSVCLCDKRLQKGIQLGLPNAPTNALKPVLVIT